MKKLNSNNLKAIVLELGFDPIQMLNYIFVLIGVIPILTLFYLIIRNGLIYQLFLGNNGFVIVIAISISLLGFLYAYILIRNLLVKLLKYALERKIAEKEKSEIMITVINDLKSPLTTVNLAINNFKDGIGGPLSVKYTGMVEICFLNMRKVFKFIDEMTNYFKNDFREIFRKHELIDLSNIIKDEINNFTQMASKAGLDLRYKVDNNARLWGDKDKISRVVMNLISNAIKYTPDGGIIDVVLSSDKNNVMFSVINTGPGLTAEEMKGLFKKFERLDKHSRIEGTGLGLSIVKDIVELHSGHIVVNSELGKNTEFRVVLPIGLQSKAIKVG